MDLSSVSKSPSYAKAVDAYKKAVTTDAYKKAVTTAATVTAYAVLARGVARELVPDELHAAVSWAVSLVRAQRRERHPAERHPAERRTVVINRHDDGRHYDNSFYADARAYLATRIDPRAMPRVCLSSGGGGGDGDSGGGDGCSGGGRILSMEKGGSMTDVFEGVEFAWVSVVGEDRFQGDSLELSFDAEHTDMALGRYVPFITATVEQGRRRERVLEIFMNDHGSWRGISHYHPATFGTLDMDQALKQSIIADIDHFLKRKEYYRRIGKAWKRGYLLYGPPGTGKSSLVAAMANYLRFNLYDLDLSRQVQSNSTLQYLLTSMPNKSILVIEDIDCCISSASRKGADQRKTPAPTQDDGNGDFDVYVTLGAPPHQVGGITLSGLLNFIDGLWSTSGEERVIVFTTNFKDRLDPALLRPGRMDMHVLMGYCGWEALKTLAHNYFVIDDHPLFPAIQELLSGVEVTPAEVSEMLLRSEDVDVALQGLIEFLTERKQERHRGK